MAACPKIFIGPLSKILAVKLKTKCSQQPGVILCNLPNTVVVVVVVVVVVTGGGLRVVVGC